MTAPDGGARPAGIRPVTATTVTPGYCRRDGWLCSPENRCDEHRVDRDPEHWSHRLLKGGSFILDGEDVPIDG